MNVSKVVSYINYRNYIRSICYKLPKIVLLCIFILTAYNTYIVIKIDSYHEEHHFISYHK